MNLFICIVLVAILLETTYTVAKATVKPVKKSKQRRKVYIDTSALMDGRILEVAKTGFLSDDIIIPRSVIREMQILADGKDSERRTRARFGMDVANQLENLPDCDVTILQDDLDHTAVDDRLLDLAKANHGAIFTTDYNLGKVAKTEDIPVLNINDLALVLRSEYLPGETFQLKITQEGSNPKQGVGHLPDGTMVVVDNARNKVGEEVEIEFVRYHQTSAGRLMFAKLTGYQPPKRKKAAAKTQTKSTQSKKA